jgi:hypothetical protein
MIASVLKKTNFSQCFLSFLISRRQYPLTKKCQEGTTNQTLKKQIVSTKYSQICCRFVKLEINNPHDATQYHLTVSKNYFLLDNLLISSVAVILLPKD